jgi:hypothetical protein
MKRWLFIASVILIVYWLDALVNLNIRIAF